MCSVRVVVLPVVAYLPPCLLLLLLFPPPPPLLSFSFQTFLLTGSDSAWKEVKAEKKGGMDLFFHLLYCFPSSLSLPFPSKALSYNLTRQTTTYCEDNVPFALLPVTHSLTHPPTYLPT